MINAAIKKWFLGMSLALTVVAASSANATIVVVDPLDVMTQKSEVVVHAVVYGQEVRSDSRGRIITLTTVEVVDGLKGAAKGDLVVIYQVGGTLNGISQWIAGNHRFLPGEEFLLFGVRYEDMVVSYGVGIGKFKIVRDETGAFLVEDVNDVVAAYRQKDGPMQMEEAVPRVFTGLEQFKGLIRDIDAASNQPRLKPTNLRVIKPQPIRPINQPLKAMPRMQPVKAVQPIAPVKLK